MRKTFQLMIVGIVCMLAACSGTKNSSNVSETVTKAQPVGPDFSADPPYMFCEQQCAFGPRTMNSDAHEACQQWIADKFRQYGMEVQLQKASLRGYDGTMLQSTNIIASYRPELTDRILLCAHWDSRPWADNDPDEANWHKPVMAANDGASGVAVMLEVARLLSDEGTAQVMADADSTRHTLNAKLGVDFICFDTEDWGKPQWSDVQEAGNSWALGSQYWAANLHKPGYKARFGILLDMVGGEGARFFQEGMSQRYALSIVEKVWAAADAIGYGTYFPKEDGSFITDDHLSVNETARIPCIDIIPYYPDCEASSFGPTWHTVNDNMEHIDRNTLKAVGQTIVQVLFSEDF